MEREKENQLVGIGREGTVDNVGIVPFPGQDGPSLVHLVGRGPRQGDLNGGTWGKTQQ